MAAPGKPILTSMAGMSGISLGWAVPPPTATAPAPDRYTVKRGLTPNAMTQIPNVSVTDASFADSGLQPGTYYYAVVAWNGQDSIESDPASATVPDQAISLGWEMLAIYVAVVVIGLIGIGLLVPFPSVGPDATLASVSASVGAFLVRFGVILLTAAFVPALVELLARTFKPPPRPDSLRTTANMGAGGLGGTIVGIVAELPELLKKPAGYGISVILLGVVLLVGAAFGFNDSATSTPSASPGSPAPATATPTPSQSPARS